MRFCYAVNPRGFFQLHAHFLALILLLIFGANLMVFVRVSSHYAGMTWVGVLPLLLAVRAFSPRQALLSGALWGAAVFTSFRAVAPMAAPNAFNIVASVLLTAAVPAAYAYAGARLTSRIGFNPLVLALMWVGVELSVSPFHLSNGLLGVMHGESTVTRLVSGLLGDSFLGFLIVFAAALFFYFVGVMQLRLVRLQGASCIYPDGFACATTRISFHVPAAPSSTSRPRAPPSTIARLYFP